MYFLAHWAAYGIRLFLMFAWYISDCVVHKPDQFTAEVGTDLDSLIQFDTDVLFNSHS